MLCVLDAVCVYVRAYDTMQTLYTHPHAHTHTHTHTQTRMDTCTHAHMYTHAHIQVCMHTRTHAHTHNGHVSCKELERAHNVSLSQAWRGGRKELDTPHTGQYMYVPFNFPELTHATLTPQYIQYYCYTTSMLPEEEQPS